jgi:surface antigen
MRSYHLATTAIAALAITTALVVPAAGAAAATRHHPARASVKSCSSTSSSGANPSKYNRTPKGAGPWHVPLDPCNTEAIGSGGKVPYYNCAYWAAEKRPDVWVNAVWKYGYSKRHPGAWRIEKDAAKAGYPINHHAKVGDLAAWLQSASMGVTTTGTTYTASPGGHVAYVEKVHPHGSITISTMGVNASTGGYTITLKYDRHTTYFIHQARG